MGTDAVAKEAMAAALKAVLDQVPTLPSGQVMPFLESLLNVSFQLLRVGGENDEFVRGMLQGAMKDLDGPALIAARRVGSTH